MQPAKVLRHGYTTGSCAAAAARAAAWMLLTGQRQERSTVRMPGGTTWSPELQEISITETAVSCAVKKDGGDDPDITTGALIFATVSRRDLPGIVVDGGEGVGRVTLPGLDQPVGEAAINSVPRKMIREHVEDVCRMTGYQGGLLVVISVPGGQELAKRTFNPRLGIQGGISILGTTGIVEPMSERALVETIRTHLRQRQASGERFLLLAPGNYGASFAGKMLGMAPEQAVLTSNFIGQTLEMCREMEFAGVLLVGHIGKLVKVAGGMMDTHSRYGDCRMEILAAYAGAAGLAPHRIAEILRCVSCDEALRILREDGKDGPVLQHLMERMEEQLSRVGAGALAVEAVVFSERYGLLGKTPRAEEMEAAIVRQVQNSEQYPWSLEE